MVRDTIDDRRTTGDGQTVIDCSWRSYASLAVYKYVQMTDRQSSIDDQRTIIVRICFLTFVYITCSLQVRASQRRCIDRNGCPEDDGWQTYGRYQDHWTSQLDLGSGTQKEEQQDNSALVEVREALALTNFSHTLFSVVEAARALKYLSRSSWTEHWLFDME